MLKWVTMSLMSLYQERNLFIVKFSGIILWTICVTCVTHIFSQCFRRSRHITVPKFSRINSIAPLRVAAGESLMMLTCDEPISRMTNAGQTKTLANPSAPALAMYGRLGWKATSYMASSNFFRCEVISWTHVLLSRFHRRIEQSWP